jgi:hypothetical protein
MHPDFSLPAHVCRVRLQTSVRARSLPLTPFATLASVEVLHA